jgi:hypothetical protein
MGSLSPDSGAGDVTTTGYPRNLSSEPTSA